MSRKITLTHTGRGPIDPRTNTELTGEGYTLYFNDLADNLDQSQYTRSLAPPSSLTFTTGGNNTVSMALTDRVEQSIESGSIAYYLANGYVAVTYEGELGGALDLVEGTELFNRDPHDGQDEVGDANDQGLRLKGKSGINNGFVDIFYDDSTSALRVVSHAPTNQEFAPGEPDADDADMYFYTSEGYKLIGDVDSDVGSGGEFRVYTGKGYDSNPQDEEGSKGGSVHFNTGNGGLFGGEGGDFNIRLGTGHQESGGRVEIQCGDSENDSDGGDFYLTTGQGDSVGNQSGDITLEIPNGANGADGGNLIIPHLAEGVLSVDADGVVGTRNYQGRETLNLANGAQGTTLTITPPVVGVLTATSSIVVSLQLDNALQLATTLITTLPLVAEIDAPNNQFAVVLDITNNAVQAQDYYISYIIAS
jgi:hypothetical protein